MLQNHGALSKMVAIREAMVVLETAQSLINLDKS